MFITAPKNKERRNVIREQIRKWENNGDERIKSLFFLGIPPINANVSKVHGF